MRLQGMKCTDAFYQNGLNTVLTPHWTLRRGLLPLSTSLYTSPVAWGRQVGVFSSSSGDGEHSEGKICTFHVISGGKNMWEMEVFAKFCMQNPHLLLFSHVVSLHLTLWKLLLEHQQNFNIRSNGIVLAFLGANQITCLLKLNTKCKQKCALQASFSVHSEAIGIKVKNEKE